ncbi:DNA-binding response regulator [Streptomyces sp. TRM 70351]|uniref:helix-turn-helix transcriptional regulator n=1 Tax=Streptomyces sp. TRM 70351 TaxID=3116552 RepID=UPI002E7B0340|nr:DNA-binding response regulator [Streptomyces sp. TRM 70351]MEE1930433.1 DNA-binding response regulator [Streptomyces sp. TRM 70351]
MTPAGPVRVALLDAHPVVLAGIETWYAASGRSITVCAKGDDVSAALAGPGRQAQVVVLDLHLTPGRCAYEELTALVAQQRRVLVHAPRGGRTEAQTCLGLGAFTFLTKAEGERPLVAATLAAADGIPYTSPALAAMLGGGSRPGRPHLAPREVDVLLSWFRSESKAAVAAGLGISVRTVNTYLDRVRVKYGDAGRPARTKAHLVARAVQDGLIALDDL